MTGDAQVVDVVVAAAAVTVAARQNAVAGETAVITAVVSTDIINR